MARADEAGTSALVQAAIAANPRPRCFVYLSSWEPLAFSIEQSFRILFMVIIGGLGSILGSFMGAAFILILPIFLNQLPGLLGIPMSTAFLAHPRSFAAPGEVVGAEQLHRVFRGWLTDLGHPVPEPTAEPGPDSRAALARDPAETSA